MESSFILQVWIAFIIFFNFVVENYDEDVPLEVSDAALVLYVPNFKPKSNSADPGTITYFITRKGTWMNEPQRCKNYCINSLYFFKIIERKR